MKLLPICLGVLLFGLTCSAQSRLPAFVGVDMRGNKVDSTQLQGKIVVVNLWFVNCPNCMAEIKELNQLVEDFKGKPDVVFLALAASPKDAVYQFLTKNAFNYNIIPNSQMLIISQFGTPDKDGQINVPFPMHYVFDKDGKMVVKEQGVRGTAVVRYALAKRVS